MIKITRISGEEDDVTRLRVDGRILGKTLDDVVRACRPFLGRPIPVLLDFSGVSFMDAEGAQAVTMLIERGVTVIGASPFVGEILRTTGKESASAPPEQDDECDATLLARLRRGDDDAFDEMTRRYAGRLIAVARRMLRDEEDARDAVQEAFLSAFKSLDRFQGEAKVSTWLHRIVVNAALMRLRTRKRKPLHAIDDLLPQFDETGDWAGQVEPMVLPEDEVERRELRTTVRRCIDLLPEPYRAVILLRDIEELDGDEAAAALHLSMSAFKSRLHRARLALRTLLARELRAADDPTACDHDDRSASHDHS